MPLPTMRMLENLRYGGSMMDERWRYQKPVSEPRFEMPVVQIKEPAYVAPVEPAYVAPVEPVYVKPVYVEPVKPMVFEPKPLFSERNFVRDEVILPRTFVDPDYRIKKKPWEY